MSTLKIKKPLGGSGPKTPRAPVRGMNTGLRPRPTLAEKEAQRAERVRASAPVAEAPRERPRGPAQPPRRERAGADHAQAPSFEPRSQAPADRSRSVNTAFSPRATEWAERAPVSAPARPRPEPPMRPSRPTAHSPSDMRLSKRMSELGIASRREADEWISKGWVRVDGKVVNELGSRVRAGQLITVDTPAKFHQARKVTVLLNKPVGYVSGQAEDGHEPAWVLIKPENQWRLDGSGIRFKREHTRGLAPAGRLDLDSVGLLVMTQDGRIAKQLIGEDSLIEKEYWVQVSPVQPGQTLSDADLARLNHGLSLDGVALKPAQVSWLKPGQLRFVLTEGRKRQIRRMCEAVGLQVINLHRVRIGQVQLGNLPPGQWRYLRLDESFGS